MAERIEPRTLSVKELLSPPDQRLLIPPYQRPYDWGKDDASDFWDDLDNCIHSGEDPFFGTIVRQISDTDHIQIVDGQQRITTFSLFLIALRAVATHNKTKEDARLAVKLNNTLNKTSDSSGRDDVVQSRLIPPKSIMEIYSSIATDQDWDGEYPQRINKKQVGRVKPVLDFFLEKLGGYSHNKLSEILTTLYRGYVIAYDIKDSGQALEIFEHVNVRGMELNAADLLKSYFIASINDVPSEDLENRWLEIVSHTDNIIRTIKHFGWVILSKKVVSNTRKYYKELKEYGVKHGETKLLNLLDEFIQAYEIVHSGEIEDLINWAERNRAHEYIAKQKKASSIIRSFRAVRLFRTAQAYPLLVTALINYARNPSNSSANAIVDLASLLENYHFINSAISQRRGNEVENLYAQYSKRLMSTKESLPNIVNELKNTLRKQRASFEEFEPKFLDLSYDSSASTLKFLYYLFDRLNNTGLSGSEVHEIYNPKLAIVKGDWEIEHIASQKPEKPYGIEEKELSDILNSIGNLLVLPSGTNKAVNNKPVSEKIPIYKKRAAKLSTVTSFVETYGKRGRRLDDISAIRDWAKERSQDLAKTVFEEVFPII